MDNIKKIDYTIKLQDEMKALEERLTKVRDEIKVNQASCSHVGVNLGHVWSDRGLACRCVLCNQKLDVTEMAHLKANGLIIEADGYLDDKHSGEESQSMEGFGNIQIMFRGLCMTYPNMDNEKIVEIFNTMISESLQSSKNEEDNKSYTKHI